MNQWFAILLMQSHFLIQTPSSSLMEPNCGEVNYFEAGSKWLKKSVSALFYLFWGSEFWHLQTGLFSEFLHKKSEKKKRGKESEYRSFTHLQKLHLKESR